MGEWISVEDRLPNDWQEVVAVVVSYYGGVKKEKTVVCARFTKEKGFKFFKFFEFEPFLVTHWMPLPPPPET